MSEATDEEIADAIDSCRRWVRRRFFTQPYCEDLEQEAAIGVLRAAEDYDRSRGTRFLTYARWWAFARSSRLLERENMEARNQCRKQVLEKEDAGIRIRLDVPTMYDGQKADFIGELGQEPEQEAAVDHRTLSQTLLEAAEQLAHEAEERPLSRSNKGVSGEIMRRVARNLVEYGEPMTAQVAREVGCSRQNANNARECLYRRARAMLEPWAS